MRASKNEYGANKKTNLNRARFLSRSVKSRGQVFLHC